MHLISDGVLSKFKGKLIQFLRVGKTRPLKDSVRENIFNNVGIAKLNQFPFNHEELRFYYDEISSKIKEKAVSDDLLHYKNKWKR